MASSRQHSLMSKSVTALKTFLEKIFTVNSRGRLSLTAPTHPRQPITMMMVPTAMRRLAADREGRDDDRVAKFPWVTESHTPTPRMPHPPNCRGNTKIHRAVRAITSNSSETEHLQSLLADCQMFFFVQLHGSESGEGLSKKDS